MIQGQKFIPILLPEKNAELLSDRVIILMASFPN